MVPLLTPVLFALVIAPALANTISVPGGRTAYMTFVALATVGLLIPLNCAFSGLGVIVDRQQGAMRELLVAPIRRSSIVVGNLLAALALTALQVAVLIVASALRGAAYQTGLRTLWFVAAASSFAVFMYGLAEILSVRLPSPVEYIAAVPAIAIVPFFFAGSLFPITSLPHWLAAVAKVLAPHPRAGPLPLRHDRDERGPGAAQHLGPAERDSHGGALDAGARRLRRGHLRRSGPALHQGRHQLRTCPIPQRSKLGMTDLDDVARIAAGDHHLAVFTVARPDGSVQASVVSAGVIADPIDGVRGVAAVLGGGTRKLELLRERGLQQLVFKVGGEWAAVGGPVRLVGPDDGSDLDLDVPETLRAVFRAAGGSHQDWSEFDRVMAAERRCAAFVRAERISSNAG